MMAMPRPERRLGGWGGIWGSHSLPSRFNPDLALFRSFGVDLCTSPGCGCRRPSPSVGPLGIEPTLTSSRSSGLTARQAGPLWKISPYTCAFRCTEIYEKMVYLLIDPHIMSLPAGFSGFPGYRRAPHKKMQKLLKQSSSQIYSYSDEEG